MVILLLGFFVALSSVNADGFEVAHVLTSEGDHIESQGASWGNLTCRRHKRDVEWACGIGGQDPNMTLAVKGGYDPDTKHDFYVCRAWCEGGLRPGKAYKDNYLWACYIAHGGYEYKYHNFQILHNVCHDLDKGLKWGDGYKGFKLPTNAVLGGYEAGNKLYICRGLQETSMHPGLLFGREFDWQCKYAWGEYEYITSTFQVLQDICPPS